MKIAVPDINRGFQVHAANVTLLPQAGSIRSGISFKNIGDTVAYINGILLSPGDPMMSFNSELIAKDMTRYELKFQNPTSGTNPSVEVIDTYITKIKTLELDEELVKPFER